MNITNTIDFCKACGKPKADTIDRRTVENEMKMCFGHNDYCKEQGCLVNHYKNTDFVFEYILKPDEEDGYCQGVKLIENDDVIYDSSHNRLGTIMINKICKGEAIKDEQEENAEYIKRAKDWIFENGKLTGAEGKEFIKYVFNQ